MAALLDVAGVWAKAVRVKENTKQDTARSNEDEDTDAS
jgi:hypothetical protein